MAITEAALTSGSKNDGSGSFTTAATASLTPGANQLVLVDVFHNASIAANAAVPTGVAGAGLTFTLVDSAVDTVAGSTLSRWRALSASPSTGAITVTFANATTAAVWSVHQYASVDITGTNGAQAIVQTAHNSNNTATVATIAVTLSAFGSTSNGASGCNAWFNVGTVQTATPRAGWTEIHDLGTLYSGSALADCLETQWRPTNDTTAQATWTANGAVYAIASELKFSPDVTVAATGQRSTFATGTAAPGNAPALTGKAITSATGSLAPGVSLALLGQSAAFTSGLLSPSSAVPLAGQSVTFSSGTVTASTGGDLTLALTGQGVAFTSGALTPSASLSLNGQSTTGTTGALAPNISLGLTGVGLTSGTGALTPSAAVVLQGQGATFTPGNVLVAGDLTIALTGQSATFTAGQMTPSLPAGDTHDPGWPIRKKRFDDSAQTQVIRESRLKPKKQPKAPESIETVVDLSEEDDELTVLMSDEQHQLESLLEAAEHILSTLH